MNRPLDKIESIIFYLNNGGVMELKDSFDTSTTKGRVSQGIWNDFSDTYEYVQKRKFIRYDDRGFRRNGIPTFRQTLAWKKLIGIMREENFCTLKFDLNHLRDTNVLFNNEFNEIYKKSKNLEVTFVCGYFFRFIEKRRYYMINFVVDNMLARNILVNIWTEDDSLKKDFTERMEEKKLAPEMRKNLRVHLSHHRFDIHYTLVENKDDPENTAYFLELPHTEAHSLRLETSLTLGDLRTFNCDTGKFRRVLKNHRKWNPIKSFCSLIGVAINMS